MAWYMVGAILLAVAAASECGWADGVKVLGAASLLWAFIQCVARADKDPYWGAPFKGDKPR